MKLIRELWTATVSVLNWLTFSHVETNGHSNGIHQFPIANTPANTPTAQVAVMEAYEPPPFEFIPPGAREGDTNFTCDYSNMPEWTFCSTAGNRECWLRNSDGREYNIHTDYEKFAPTGIDRYIDLDVTNMTYNGDGLNFTWAKVFNKQYPGPWIQACWGDTIHVKVTNHLPFNGTSVHWHGIRQWFSMHMDGVNGITQCPIAPGDYFVYTFKAMQYGSSWYHSHYSVQYADGLQGPITIHGPASAPYDTAKIPLIMTDWDHAPAFTRVYDKTKYSIAPSILVNGKGNVTRHNSSIIPVLDIPEPWTLHFARRNPANDGRARRYLLRLINTSFDTTFVFSIDHHWLQVIGADFVMIEPYYTHAVLVGIGQRYHVVVEANPVPYEFEPDGSSEENFWIRTHIANCRNAPFNNTEYMKTAILRYNNESKADPTTKEWPGIDLTCRDEPYEKLKPKFTWTVGSPVNGAVPGEKFDIEFVDKDVKEKKQKNGYALATFELKKDEPLRINYANPIFTRLANFTVGNQTEDQKSWVVIPEEYTSSDWVWMVLNGHTKDSRRVAHPMHLHGHDFAILQVNHTHLYSGTRDLNPKRDNPPRRDVVLVPRNGFVLVAFKADNPGTWLLHCHIAFHASEGLAMQILERQKDANDFWPYGKSSALKEADRVCENWKKWQNDRKNWWDPKGDPRFFQDDSGI